MFEGKNIDIWPRSVWPSSETCVYISSMLPQPEKPEMQCQDRHWRSQKMVVFVRFCMSRMMVGAVCRVTKDEVDRLWLVVVSTTVHNLHQMAYIHFQFGPEWLFAIADLELNCLTPDMTSGLGLENWKQLLTYCLSHSLSEEPYPSIVAFCETLKRRWPSNRENPKWHRLSSSKQHMPRWNSSRSIPPAEFSPKSPRFCAESDDLQGSNDAFKLSLASNWNLSRKWYSL